MATQCPIAREQFDEHAPKLTLQIGGLSDKENTPFGEVLEPTTFSSDSMGWKCNQKAYVVIDGVRCKVQINANLTIVGSKYVD